MGIADESNGVNFFFSREPFRIDGGVRQEDNQRHGDDESQDNTDNVKPFPRSKTTDEITDLVVFDELVLKRC